MKHLLTTWLACLTLVVAMSMPASAQAEGPSPWDSPTQSRDVLSSFPAQDPTSMPQAPATVATTDPDHTGYPYINNWKGNLVRDPKVFLNDQERQDLTQARVDLTAALAPIVLLHQNRFRNCLSPAQLTRFEGIVATQDLERLAAMNDDDCNCYVAEVSQRVRLDNWQERELRAILDHLMRKIAPAQTQYAARFDQEIASADQRVVAERTARNATISTGTTDMERK